MSSTDAGFWYLPTARAVTPELEQIWGRFSFYALAAGLVMNALAAYAFGPIPIEWLSRIVFMAGAGMMLAGGVLPQVRAFVPAFLLLIWAVISTVAGFINHSEQLWFPILTTPYPIFIFLRILNLIAPLCCGYLVITACERYSFRSVTKFIIWLGTIAALYAIYAYAAELLGLPEISRSRLGTGGGAQSTTFSYAFHRALGTFREPSHLSEWLLAPIFTSLAMRNRVVNVHTLTMTLALLLTGSLSGFGGFVGGLMAAATLANPLRASSWKVLGGITGVLAIGLGGFLIFASGKHIDYWTLFQVIWDRIQPMLKPGGVENTNRGDVLEAVLRENISLFGYGFGRANIILSNIYTAGMVNATLFVLSYHSLYLHYLYATGVVGLGFLLAFIVIPIYQFWNVRVVQMRRQYSFIAGGVVAYAVTNSLLFDELTPQFVMMIALVITLVRVRQRQNYHVPRQVQSDPSETDGHT